MGEKAERIGAAEVGPDRRRWPLVLGIWGATVLAACVVVVLPNRLPKGVVDLLAAPWSCQWADAAALARERPPTSGWRACRYPADPEGRAGRRWLWLAGRLPAIASGNGHTHTAILIGAVERWFRLWIDGAPVATPLGPQPRPGLHGYPWFMVATTATTLRPHRVAALVYSDDPVFVGLYPPLLYGEEHGVWTALVRYDLGRTVVAFLFVILGAALVATGLGFVRWRRLAWLGAFVVALGAYTFAGGLLKQLVWDEPAAWRRIEVWSLLAAAWCFLRFWVRYDREGAAGTRVLATAHFVLLVAGTLVVADLDALDRVLAPTQWLLIADALWILWATTRMVLDEPAPARAAMAGGVAAFTLIVLRDLAMALGWVPWLGYRAHYGLLFFVGGLLAAAVVEVTEAFVHRDRAVRAWTRSQRLVAAMVHWFPDVVFLVDRDGRLRDIHVPEGFADSPFATLSPGGDLQRELERLRPPRRTAFARAWETVQAAFAAGEERSCRFAPDGPGGPVYELRILPVGEEEALGIVRDVSELEARTRALEAAKREAERIAALKSAILANVSHEIRTPLTAIIGFAELLLMQTAGTEYEPKVRLIHDSGKRLLAMLGNLLDLASLEAGKLVFEPRPVPVIPVMRRVAALFGATASRRGVSLVVQVGEADLAALADEQRLEQILVNLVANAVRHTEEGEVTLAAHRVREEGRNWIEIEVRDTGSGMPPGFEERAFEPFVRASFEEGGVGLGLAIVRRLVEVMGGRIALQSRWGVGTVVRIYLPEAPSPEASSGSIQAA